MQTVGCTKSILTAVCVCSAALHRTTTKSLEDFNSSRRVWRSATYACALVLGLSCSTIAVEEASGRASSESQSRGNCFRDSAPESDLLQTDVESRTAGVRAAFDAIDTDNDGRLSRPELLRVIRGLRGPETPQSEVEDAANAAFAQLDKDLDGSISFDEFSAATVRTCQRNVSLLKLFHPFRFICLVVTLCALDLTDCSIGSLSQEHPTGSF
jgi:hypothetical protein